MAESFFFYDLETSGLHPSCDRIMQFAGQRTDHNLQPVGEPINVLIRLSPDILPDPEAVLLTGITPQMTIMEGISEVEFLDFFFRSIVTDNTIFVGYNNIRFDDEFMRATMFRNFYDPYEWHYKQSCSRWDLLDVVRLTRALKPEGITWPVDGMGAPTNRLELLTSANQLLHDNAHDALSDVQATIAVARLIRQKQGQLFDYVLGLRRKAEVSRVITSGRPFTYTSSYLPAAQLHTSIMQLVCVSDDTSSALCLDLREDPAKLLRHEPSVLAAAMQPYTKDEAPRLPILTIKFNRCPAVIAGVPKDPKTLERLTVNRALIERHAGWLQDHLSELQARFAAAKQIVDQMPPEPKEKGTDPETRMYDGFIDQSDKQLSSRLRAAQPALIMEFESQFHDERLRELCLRYTARNYPQVLTSDQRQRWDAFVMERLSQQLPSYFEALNKRASGASETEQFLLTELQLYGESIFPADATN